MNRRIEVEVEKGLNDALFHVKDGLASHRVNEVALRYLHMAQASVPKMTREEWAYLVGVVGSLGSYYPGCLAESVTRAEGCAFFADRLRQLPVVEEVAALEVIERFHRDQREFLNMASALYAAGAVFRKQPRVASVQE